MDLTILLCLLFTTVSVNADIRSRRDFYAEFEEDWCREHRARGDWRQLLHSCPGSNRQWGLDQWPERASTNGNLSYIAWIDPKPVGHYTTIQIQSVTTDNRTKLIGGDFWRAVVRGPAGIAGSVNDLGNGSYEFSALFEEPGMYSVHLFLDYTLCHGLKNPPIDWFRRGCRHGSFQPAGALGEIQDYIQQPFLYGATINISLSDTVNTPQDKRELMMLMEDSRDTCPENCTLVWDGFGRWVGSSWVPFLNDPQPPRSGHFAGSGVLLIYGDSINRLFFDSVRSRPLCTQIFQGCYYSPVWVYSLIHQAKDEMDLSYGGKELNITQILEELRTTVKHPMMDHNSALLINTGIHLLKSTSFRNYQKVIKGMIRVLKESYRGRVVWKTITALGKQTYLYTGCVRRFHTEQRIKLFNAYAVRKMCDAGFAVLDVYPISNAFPEGTTDGVHYKPEAFIPAADALERYFS